MTDTTSRPVISRRFDELRFAVMFLTRFPVGTFATPPSHQSAVWAFPVAGALHALTIGLVYAGALWIGLPPVVSAFLAIAAGLRVSGAFHEDGLADCADGFGGGMTRARKLEIMHDSRIGTYGTVALVTALGLRATLIAEQTDALTAIGMLVGLGAFTRGGQAIAMLLVPAAREDGMTADTSDGLSRAVALSAIAIGTFAALLLSPNAIAAIVAAAIGMAVMFNIAMRQIGGLTGDVLGAAQVIGELSGMLAICALR